MSGRAETVMGRRSSSVWCGQQGLRFQLGLRCCGGGLRLPFPHEQNHVAVVQLGLGAGTGANPPLLRLWQRLL